MKKLFVFGAILFSSLQSFAGSVNDLKISLTLGEQQSISVARVKADSVFEISQDALKAADPLSLVSVEVSANATDSVAIHAAAAYSAPSFAPVALTIKEIDAASNEVLGETRVSLEVLAVLEIRLLGDNEKEESVFDSPTEIVLQAHSGGVKLVFIDEDPREGAVHRIHGAEPIKHASMEEYLKKKGDTYTYLVTETKEARGEYRCHEHNDYSVTKYIKFNSVDEAALRSRQFRTPADQLEVVK
jgi:hypothetical protein